VLDSAGTLVTIGELHKEPNTLDSTSGVLEDLVVVLSAALLVWQVVLRHGLIKNCAVESMVT
jgi:hypothetical protein